MDKQYITTPKTMLNKLWILDRHSRCHDFQDCGRGTDFHARLAAIRTVLSAATRPGAHL